MLLTAELFYCKTFHILQSTATKSHNASLLYPSRCTVPNDPIIADWVLKLLLVDDQGFDLRQGTRDFIFCKTSRLVMGSAELPCHCLIGAASAGLKRTRCEADSLPLSRANVKKGCSYTTIVVHAFMGYTVIRFSLPLAPYYTYLHNLSSWYNVTG